MTEGVLRLEYKPRSYFVPFHNRLKYHKVDGVKRLRPDSLLRACLVCHRGAGKTVACVVDLIDAAIKCSFPRGRFAIIGPTLKQEKTNAWDYMRDYALRLQSKEVHVEINETELRVDFGHNQSRVRIFGSDNPDNLRGQYFDGVVFDEYADIDPRIWPEIVLPRLGDPGRDLGWVVFIGTPRGHNSFYQIHTNAIKDPKWFYMMLKAADSNLHSVEQLEAIKAEQTPEQYAQEFECSFEAAIQGAYYAKLMEAALTSGRICSVPHNPDFPVFTAWDLGWSDATAIIFAQVVGREIHIIDYIEASHKPLGYYVGELRERADFVYEGHFLPHDVMVSEQGTGKTRLETLQTLGLNNCRVLLKHEIPDGINAVRQLIPRCVFDKTKCLRLTEALSLYRSDLDLRQIDPTTRQPILKDRPKRDWTTHPADAMRYLAAGIDERGMRGFWKPIEYKGDRSIV